MLTDVAGGILLPAWKAVAKDYGLTPPTLEQVQRAMGMLPEVAVMREFFWTTVRFDALTLILARICRTSPHAIAQNLSTLITLQSEKGLIGPLYLMHNCIQSSTAHHHHSALPLVGLRQNFADAKKFSLAFALTLHDASYKPAEGYTAQLLPGALKWLTILQV